MYSSLTLTFIDLAFDEISLNTYYHKGYSDDKFPYAAAIADGIVAQTEMVVDNIILKNVLCYVIAIQFFNNTKKKLFEMNILTFFKKIGSSLFLSLLFILCLLAAYQIKLTTNFIYFFIAGLFYKFIID